MGFDDEYVSSEVFTLCSACALKLKFRAVYVGSSSFLRRLRSRRSLIKFSSLAIDFLHMLIVSCSDIYVFGCISYFGVGNIRVLVGLQNQY